MTKKKTTTAKSTTKKSKTNKNTTTTENTVQSVVEQGSTITVHYKGTTGEGEEFDSSWTRDEPMTVVVGDNQLIPGFSDGVIGMTAGETKKFVITSDRAYGPRTDQAIVKLPAPGQPGSIFPSQGVTLREGEQLPLQTADGREFIGPIVEVNDKEITVDLNHPLAGKDLTFEVKLLDISPIPTGNVMDVEQ